MRGGVRRLDGELKAPLAAARAHLLERAGQIEAAIALYRAAAARTSSLPERNYLILRAAKLRSPAN